METYTSWEQFPREDLNEIPMMEAAGFTVHFKDRDAQRGRTTPEQFPFWPVSFSKGNFHVWKIHEGWQTARLVDGYFVDHEPVLDLALVREMEIE